MKKYCLAILVILILGNVLLYLALINEKRKNSELLNINNDSISSMRAYIEGFYKLNGKAIPEVKLFDIINNQYNSKSVWQNQKTLLLLFSTNGCNVCLDSFIKEANELVDKGSINVYGVAYSFDKSYFKRYIRLRKIKFPVFLDIDKKFKAKLGKNEIPVAFLIDTNGKILQTHFLTPVYEEFNELFFEKIKGNAV